MAAASSLFRTLARNPRHPILPPPKWLQQSSRLSTTSPEPAISTIPQPDPQGEEKCRSTWSKVLLFIPGFITFGLGTWQIFRRREKINMLDYRQSRLSAEPLKGNEILPSSGSFDSLEFRKVQLKGVFDEKKSIFVGPRSRSISGVTENGYYIITPLFPVPDDTESILSPVLVNRGWVPRSWRDKALAASEDEPLQSMSTSTRESAKTSWWRFWPNKHEGLEDRLPNFIPVEVIGVVRGSENPSIFVPANDPNASQWFYVDVPALARACGIEEKTIYVEEINEHVNPSRPYPIPKDFNMLIRTSVMPQDHLNYTFTWYSLSAAVTFMAIKRLKPRKSKR